MRLKVVYCVFIFFILYSCGLIGIRYINEDADDNEVNPLLNKAYIHSAYRISNHEIRITLTNQYKDPFPIYYQYGDKIGKLHIECELPECLDFYSKPCVMIGYFGIIKEHFVPSIDVLYLSRDPTYFKKSTKVEIHDVRIQEDHRHEHQLGVCVQPIYFHADYVLFIHFFEFWLSQGATKFYIYKESYTKEVEEIITFYNKTSNADIEIIDWSLLPYKDDNINPNLYNYRIGMMLGIADCLHRSRSTVKFISQTDLDEFIFIKNGMTVADFMEEYSQKDPYFASLQSQSQRVILKSNVLGDVLLPQDVNFSVYQDVLVEKEIFPRPLYSKIIYRPERVFRVHTHLQYTPEKISPSNKRYYNAKLPPDDGIVFHIRRLSGEFEIEEVTASTMLKELSIEMNNRFLERVNGYRFADLQWNNIAMDVVRSIENCKKKNAKMKDTKCANVHVCENALLEEHRHLFVRASNSWISL